MKAVLTMAHDVFISHAHADKPAADAACAALEARGIRCWIAPRDIDPGQDWAACIVEAIRGAQIMLLVFSRHANESPQVKREVERAGNSGKVLLPLRIEDVLPAAALEFYLSTPHWLDAITKPFEAHLEKLADACLSLLAVTGRSPQDATGDPALVVAASATEQPSAAESEEVKSSVSRQPPTRGSMLTPAPAQLQPADRRPPVTPWWRRQRRQMKLALIAAIVVILTAAGITGYLLWPNASRQTWLPQTVLAFAGLNKPVGVAVDSDGNVYVVDFGNNRVLELAPRSSTPSMLPFTGLAAPGGVAVDGAGNLYVTDRGNNRVLELAAGSSTPTVLPFTGDHLAFGVAVDAAGGLYVAEFDNNRVVKCRRRGRASRACCRSPASPPPAVWRWMAAATSTSATRATIGC